MDLDYNVAADFAATGESPRARASRSGITTAVGTMMRESLHARIAVSFAQHRTALVARADASLPPSRRESIRCAR